MGDNVGGNVGNGVWVGRGVWVGPGVFVGAGVKVSCMANGVQVGGTSTIRVLDGRSISCVGSATIGAEAASVGKTAVVWQPPSKNETRNNPPMKIVKPTTLLNILIMYAPETVLA